jgi:Uri superfamily endonuclease
MPQPSDIIDKIPILPGAYGIVVRLQEPVRLEIGKFGRVELSNGLYFYGGSAYGPGGLKARLGRHIRAKKSLHWHIDHVTSRGKFVALGMLENGNECDLVAAAIAREGAAFPVPSFGSSDCQTCISHMVNLKRASDITKIFDAAKADESWLFQG